MLKYSPFFTYHTKEVCIYSACNQHSFPYTSNYQPPRKTWVWGCLRWLPPGRAGQGQGWKWHLRELHGFYKLWVSYLSPLSTVRYHINYNNMNLGKSAVAKILNTIRHLTPTFQVLVQTFNSYVPTVPILCCYFTMFISSCNKR